jgi:hypothetical protein
MMMMMMLMMRRRSFFAAADDHDHDFQVDNSLLFPSLARQFPATTTTATTTATPVHVVHAYCTTDY